MKVLIATDGSEFSQRAVQKCCRMFDESDNTKIRIISVSAPIAPGVGPEALPPRVFQDLRRVADERAADAISKAEHEVLQHFNLTVDLSSVVENGSAKKAVVEEAERWGADVIVMGTHGHSFWNRVLLGSVSDAVLREAPCSVMIVRGADQS